MLFEGKQGTQNLSSGAIGALRLDKTGASVVAQGHASMQEAVC